LRPAAELLPTEVPGFVERLLKVVSHSSTQRLPASLAVCLYFKLQLPDDQVAADSPRLLALLGEVSRLADSTPPKCRGTVAFSTLLARQLTSRARAMTDSVLSASRPAARLAPMRCRRLAVAGHRPHWTSLADLRGAQRARCKCWALSLDVPLSCPQTRSMWLCCHWTVLQMPRRCSGCNGATCRSLPERFPWSLALAAPVFGAKRLSTAC